MRDIRLTAGAALAIVLMTAGLGACGPDHERGISSESDPNEISPTPTSSPEPTPAPTPTSTSTPPPDSEATLQQQVLDLTNQHRAAAGVAPLVMDARLTAAAQKFAELMVTEGFFGHTSPDGSNAGDRILAEGYVWRTWGENIAYGYTTPEAVMSAWMNSSGHRANILNFKFKDLGVGVYLKPSPNGGSGTLYWVQNFGAR